MNKYDKISKERKKIIISFSIKTIVNTRPGVDMDYLNKRKNSLLLVFNEDEKTFANEICDLLISLLLSNNKQSKFNSKSSHEIYDLLISQYCNETSLSRDKNDSTNNEVTDNFKANEGDINFFELYNPNSIRKNRNGQLLLKYFEKDRNELVTNNFSNSDFTYSITILGELDFTTLNGDDYIKHYRIAKTNKKGECIDVFYVYSSININLMSTNMEYMNAVLNELLNDKNIKRLNSNRYIGNLSKNEEGYSVEYIPEEYTAVSLYQKEKNKIISKNKE